MDSNERYRGRGRSRGRNAVFGLGRGASHSANAVFGRGRGASNSPNAGFGRGRGASNSARGAFSKFERSYGISYDTIKELCKEMDSKMILSGSSDLLRRVQAESFYYRMDDLWPDVKKRAQFLRVVVETASSIQIEVMALTQKFIRDVLTSKLIKTIVDDNITPMPFDPEMQTPWNAEIAAYIVQLLVIGFSANPANMDPLLPSVHAVVSTLKSVADMNFLSADVFRQLETLEAVLKDKHAARTAMKVQQQAHRRAAVEGSAGEPPNNFRFLPVIPDPEEDFAPNYQPYLRKAIVEGSYVNSEHYLDVHFRLLREDLIRPLREGIVAYQRGGTRNTDLYVHQDVEMRAPRMHEETGELLSYAFFKNFRRIRFDKRLKYGSLVCLSSDNFQQELIFATVCDRDEKTIMMGEIGLKFEDVITVNIKANYKMVESPAFFEAYKPVMLALQTLPQDDPIPFAKYLVDVNTQTQIPEYLEDNRLDFKCLIKEENYQFFNSTRFNVTEIQRTLTPEICGMDQSQFDALVYALTTDLAIIQGPPGTGKTFMGLQLAKLLFENSEAWSPRGDERPMLVVCYTNHALDQFLEGISKFLKQGIIRVGGRCKNPALEQFVLQKSRNWKKIPTQLRAAFFDAKEKAYKLKAQIQKLSSKLKYLETRLVSPKLLLPLLSEGKNASTKQLADQIYSDSETLWMSTWLTQARRNDRTDLRDIAMIRQLVYWMVPEIKAKNALATAYKAREYFDVFSLVRKLRNGPYQNLSDIHLLPGAKLWPSLKDIDAVMRLGFTEVVAVEMLGNSDLGTIRDEFVRTRAIQQNVQNAAVPLTEEAYEFNIEDLHTGEDEHRMLYETNIFEEGIRRKTFQPKEKELSQKWIDSEIFPYFKELVVGALPLPEGEAKEVKDVWKLPLQKRWRLYQYWIQTMKTKLQDELEPKQSTYSRKVRELTELRGLCDVEHLKNAKVVGMTTTGAAKHQSTLRALRPRILIVEEAAEVLEAHLVASLTHACQHLILIGDHKQLRPNPAVYELAKHYNLEISLFERLVKNGYPFRMLENQHRMCQVISRTLMPHFYENLQDDPSVLEREDVRGVTKNLLFINHPYPEVQEREFKSHRNPFEADYAISLARYFIQQNYTPEDITILCTYLDQFAYLRRRANEYLGHNHGINIQTVDNYQGEECNIIILSLVRSTNPENKIGFLNIDNRVCVALSRARMGLYVICNLDFLAAVEKNERGLWKNIKASAEEVGAVSDTLIVRCELHGNEQEIKSFEDFSTKCPEGGCDLPCSGRLPCGHACNKPCHVDDIDHTEVKCLKACERKCSGGHPCKKDCWEKCDLCKIKVVKTLPCSHQKKEFCHVDPEKSKCLEPCQKMLPCGHKCTKKCGENCITYCAKMVERKIPNCGHVIEIACSADVNIFKCHAEVEKEWPLCKHVAKAKCSDDVTEIPCKSPCNSVLPDCSHRCKGTCGACRNGRIHVKCEEPCKRILICGHECTEKCSKECPPCSKPCETSCTHSQCGSGSIRGERMKKARKIFSEKKHGKKPASRTCGQPCPPCMEKCPNKCEHRKCEMLCSEVCNVSPCNEPCSKKLSCDPSNHGMKEDDAEYVPHLCLGLCGDNCPAICKICDPEKFEELQEIFLGHEEDDDARFVQLEDCSHILEVKGLDEWIQKSLAKDDASKEITKITCPRCATPICRSKRYVSLLNQRALDIENVKQLMRGLSADEQKMEHTKLSAEVTEAFAPFKEVKAGEILALEVCLKKMKPEMITRSWLTTTRNILNILKTLSVYHKRIGESMKSWNFQAPTVKITKPILYGILEYQQISDFCHYLECEMQYLFGRMDRKLISETTVQQIAHETQRFGFLVEFLIYLAKVGISGDDLSPAVVNMVKAMFDELNGSKEFDEKLDKDLSEALKKIAELHPVSDFVLSETERIEIIRALSAHVQHWYKCPNGHIYGIGDCGQAYEKAKCPECKAPIGGAAHRLEVGNQDAQVEMTGLAIQPLDDPFEARW